MATIYRCDKCGRTVKGLSYLYKIIARKANEPFFPSSSVSEEKVELDLCTKCKDSVMKWANKPNESEAE